MRFYALNSLTSLYSVHKKKIILVEFNYFSDQDVKLKGIAI